MQRKHRLAESCGFKASLLLLALSVFGWGLGAKLALYKAAQPSSTASCAKMSTDNRSVHTAEAVALEEQEAPSRPRVYTLNLDENDALSIASLSLRQVEVSLYRPSILQMSGPNLRRPPPAVAS